MNIKCGNCGNLLQEGEEIEARCFAYYHELKSKVVFSISKPHNVIADSLQHVDCGRY